MKPCNYQKNSYESCHYTASLLQKKLSPFACTNHLQHKIQEVNGITVNQEPESLTQLGQSILELILKCRLNGSMGIQFNHPFYWMTWT